VHSWEIIAMSQSYQVDTDRLQIVAEHFGQQSAAISALLHRLTACVDAVRSSDWRDAGSARFLAEMDELVLPQLRLLRYFLTQSHQQTDVFIRKNLEMASSLDALQAQIPQLKAVQERMAANLAMLERSQHQAEIQPSSLPEETDDDRP
jgi:hypothetical protein